MKEKRLEDNLSVRLDRLTKMCKIPEKFKKLSEWANGKNYGTIPSYEVYNSKIIAEYGDEIAAWEKEMEEKKVDEVKLDSEKCDELQEKGNEIVGETELEKIEETENVEHEMEDNQDGEKTEIINDNGKKKNGKKRYRIEGITWIPVDSIIINPERNPRRFMDPDKLLELKLDIKENGVQIPLEVLDLEDETFELISGERRLTALKMLEKEGIKIDRVKCTVFPFKTPDENLLLHALISNRGVSLTDGEVGRAVFILHDVHGWDFEKIAARFGVSVQTIKVNRYDLWVNTGNELQKQWTSGEMKTATVKEMVKNRVQTAAEIDETIDDEKRFKADLKKDKLELERWFWYFIQGYMSQALSETYLKKMLDMCVEKYGTVSKETESLMKSFIDAISETNKKNKKIWDACQFTDILTRYLEKCKYEVFEAKLKKDLEQGQTTFIIKDNIKVELKLKPTVK
jgi:transposase